MERPLVTIGVPVYNDEPWLARSLDRLVGQDYEHLEIILADDGSADRSAEICRGYAQKDPRIRFVQNRFNLGPVRNHNLLFELSRGDYFAWGSGHDYFDASFVSRALALLQEEVSLVLVYGQAQYIGYDEKPLQRTTGLLEARGTDPTERFLALLGGLTNPNLFYGLYRSSVLARSALHGKGLGGDFHLLAELALMGGIAQLDEVLVYRKMDKAEEKPAEAAQRWIRNIIRPRGIGLEGVTPWLDMARGYFRIVDEAPLEAPVKERLLEGVVRYCRENFVGLLKADVKSLAALRSSLGDDGALLSRHYHAGGVLERIQTARALGLDNAELAALESFCLSPRGIQPVRAAGNGKAATRPPAFAPVPAPEGPATGGPALNRRECRLPFRNVYFEICGLCNARCFYCVTGNKASRAPRGMVPVELFSAALQKLLQHGWIDPQKSVMNLFTWGEPFLHPKLDEIIGCCNDRGFRYVMSSNASVVPVVDEGFCRNLAQLIFSMPGYSQASYDRIHGFRFETVRDNITRIVGEVRRYNPRVSFQLNFHLYRFNTHEVEAGEAFARQLGMQFNPYYAYINSLNQFCGWIIGDLPAGESKRIEAELFTGVMREGLAAGAALIPEGYRCPQLDYLTVDEFANVATCCGLPRDYRDYACGNLLLDDPEAILRAKVTRSACTRCVSAGFSRFYHFPKAYVKGKHGEGA